MKELIKFLQECAAALKEKDAAMSAKFLAQAAEIEKATANQSIATQVEEVIAARVKAGEYFTKATYEAAVADAKKVGADEVNKAHEAKAAEAKKQADATAARMKEITEAKVNPKLAMADNKTLEETVASMPATEEGDKTFKLLLSALVSQSKESTKTDATASDNKGKKLNPLGGSGKTEDAKKRKFL